MSAVLIVSDVLLIKICFPVRRVNSALFWWNEEFTYPDSVFKSCFLLILMATLTLATCVARALVTFSIQEGPCLSSNPLLSTASSANPLSCSQDLEVKAIQLLLLFDLLDNSLQ
jgi:hypothetical protein